MAGNLFEVALHLHMDPNWHTYWINPGDAGLATMIKWTLPPGWSTGPIQWPTPEVHMMGPLTTYGYGGDVYLLTTITPPKIDLMGAVPDLQAHATWLVCQEECIPGKADLAVKVVTPEADGNLHRKPTFFNAARSRLPNVRDRLDHNRLLLRQPDRVRLQIDRASPFRTGRSPSSPSRPTCSTPKASSFRSTAAQARRNYTPIST